MQLSPFEILELVHVDPLAKLREAMERSIGPDGSLQGNEYCTGCGKDMGFPADTHVKDSIRFKNGARYSQYGFGQKCKTCPLPFDEIIG